MVLRNGKYRENGLASLFPAGSPRLPDFRNLGTWLRVLLAVNAMALVAVLVRARGWAGVPAEFAQLAAVVEPATLCGLLLLGALRSRLVAMSTAMAAAVVVVIAALAGMVFAALLMPLNPIRVSLGGTPVSGRRWRQASCWHGSTWPRAPMPRR